MGITDSIDITPSQRNIIISLLTRYLPGVTVWAYGSRVKWTSRPDSDLDLVSFTTPRQQRQISALKEALEESSLPFRVDMMVWEDAPENFRKNILNQYVVLVEKPREKQEDHAALNNWRSSTWGDEITLEYGKALRGYENAIGQFRVYGSNGPVGWTTQPLAPGPGVILGRKGAYRGVQYSKEPFYVIDTAYYVVPKTQLDMRWVYYAIKHYKLGEIDDGSPIPSTTRAAVYMMDLDVPPISEQRAIAHILGTFDDKIELNLKMSKVLEDLARALFKSWFVDFEPVRAKVEGRDNGLPNEISNLFPDSFEESELGEVPKGWKVALLGDLCNRVAMGPFGSDIKTDNFVEVGVPVVRGSNLTKGFVENSFVFVTEEKANQLRNANAFPGDIVITHRGTLGQVGLIPKKSLFPRYVVSQSQMLLSVNQDLATSRYVYNYLQSFSGQQALLANTSQTGVPAIARPTTSVKSIRLLIPPVGVLRCFSKLTDPMYSRCEAGVKESRTLAAQRDALLPKLLSGDISVSIGA